MNADTVSILDDFCKKYAEYRSDTIIKPIIEKVLNGVLYYVFWRSHSTKDPLKECEFRNLVKPFTSENDAINWIYQNGYNLIGEYDMNGGFLYIQEIDHDDVSKGIFNNCGGIINSAFLEENMFKIFAFDEDGYEILLKEHINNFVIMGRNEYYCIPHWIRYINGNNITVGLNEKYYKILYHSFKLHGCSEEFLKEFESHYNEFNNNPRLWIEKYVDGDEDELVYYSH